MTSPARSTSPNRPSLLEEMRTEARKPKGPPCGMGVILDQLGSEERAQLEEALADRLITAHIIATVLSNHGHRVAIQTVGRHRGGRCACGTR